jgi:hypothetical protein
MVGSFNVHPEAKALFPPISLWQRVLLPDLSDDPESASDHQSEDEAC